MYTFDKVMGLILLGETFKTSRNFWLGRTKKSDFAGSRTENM
jgi:hypothetical protein